MPWVVEHTDEFERWWLELDSPAKAAVDAHISLLEDLGPHLDFPYTSAIYGSRHGAMRELRVKSKGRPLRVLHAFDPRRHAVLLVGGDKTGDDRFYDRLVPAADKLYDEHLGKLKSTRKGKK